MKKLCSLSHLNYTLRIIFNKYPENHLFYKDSNDLPNGKLVDLLFERLFLDKLKNIKNYCKFLWIESSGTYNEENKTYDGAIGLIADNKADIFSKPNSLYIHPKFVDYSNVFFSTLFYPCQLIDTDKSLNNIDSLEFLKFLIPSFGFAILLFGSLIFYFGFIWIMTKILKIKIKNLKVVFFSFVIFSFLIANLYNSNLNTSNVIVDTSDLIDNFNDALKTNRELCFMENSEIDYFVKAKNDSLAYKIFLKANQKDICFYLKDSKPGNFLKKKINEVFFLINNQFIYLASKISQTITQKNTFTSSQPFYELLRVFILSRGKQKIKQHINECMTLFSENGLMKEFYRKFNRVYESSIPNLAKTGKDGFIHYNSIQKYIEDHTFIESLKYNKMQFIFIIYFAILIIILSIYLIHHLINYLKKSMRKFKNYCLNIFKKLWLTINNIKNQLFKTKTQD